MKKEARFAFWSLVSSVKEELQLFLKKYRRLLSLTRDMKDRGVMKKEIRFAFWGSVSEQSFLEKEPSEIHRLVRELNAQAEEIEDSIEGFLLKEAHVRSVVTISFEAGSIIWSGEVSIIGFLSDIAGTIFLIQQIVKAIRWAVTRHLPHLNAPPPQIVVIPVTELAERHSGGLAWQDRSFSHVFIYLILHNTVVLTIALLLAIMLFSRSR